MRVVADGRICAFVTDNMLVKGEKFPVVADITRTMIDAGFRYRDRITWVKPKGYTRISRRSGVVLQHPPPMYFYPDNITESILLFQKGKFDYESIKDMDPAVIEWSNGRVLGWLSSCSMSLGPDLPRPTRNNYKTLLGIHSLSALPSQEGKLDGAAQEYWD